MQNLFFVTQHLLNREISRFSASLFLAATLAVLAGCGSGGSGGTPVSKTTSTTPTTTTSNTATTGTPAASIQLLASATQMPSSGATTVNLTAVVLSATKQAVSGRTVTFSTGTDTTAFVNNISASGVSDANGLVTAQLNLGNDKTDRMIAVTATADAASATNSVDVTGTTITITGNNSVSSGGTVPLQITVKDSAGNLLPNITVSVTSKNSNTIVLTPSSGVTNSSGQITATVSATNAGADVITATGAGASATQALTVSSANFAFTTPAADTQIPLNTTPTVTVNWTDTVTSPGSGPVNFSTSRGTIAASAPLVSGLASVTVSSTTAGPAIITASGPTGTPAATLNVIFVATSASKMTVAAIPSTVQVTTGVASQTNNSSTITVVVRDANDNLVKNASVSFNLSDSTGGSLTSSSGTTDVTGTTSATYVAGSSSSAQNGVTVTATVDKVNGVAITPVTGSTSLTVSGQSLQVQLGTDNLVGGTAPINTKTYVAVVTDAGGNPVVGATVQFALRPGRYNKGFFVLDPTGSFWVQNITATCPNEDLNFNGSLDPGEGLVAFPAGQTPTVLPGDVASVNGTGVTNSSGIATATITYAKSYSFWVEETLQASTSVVSNTPPAQTTFFLPGAASDYNNKSVAPPGQPSPFGTDNSCADTL